VFGLFGIFAFEVNLGGVRDNLLLLLRRPLTSGSLWLIASYVFQASWRRILVRLAAMLAVSVWRKIIQSHMLFIIFVFLRLGSYLNVRNVENCLLIQPHGSSFIKLVLYPV